MGIHLQHLQHIIKFPYDSVYFKAALGQAWAELSNANFHTIPSILKPEVKEKAAKDLMKFPYDSVYFKALRGRSILTGVYEFPYDSVYFKAEIIRPWAPYHAMGFPYDSVYFKARNPHRQKPHIHGISIRFRLF